MSLTSLLHRAPHFVTELMEYHWGLLQLLVTACVAAAAAAAAAASVAAAAAAAAGTVINDNATAASVKN